MPGKNQKALDRRDQSSKGLTLQSIGRKETTRGRENESQPPKNQSPNFRPETTFKAHIEYTEENTI